MLASDKILALDIGAATVKVAEFQPSKTSGGLRLTNFNYAELGIDPEHEESRKALIISTLANALKEKNIRATRVIFSVPGQSVFTRFVKLPPVEESKVVQIIQYEAQQNVPFPIEEVIWDYQLLGSTPSGELEVVLLAIKSDIIEELREDVESAGLQTEMVDVAPMALCNAVRYNEGDTEGCTMIVDIGARTTNLLFLEKGRVFSRSIPIAGNAITNGIKDELNISFAEAEQLKKLKGFVALGGAYEEPPDIQQAQISKIIRNQMTRLHADVIRSVNYYKGQQGGSTPQRLLLSGGSSIIPYTDRFFQEKFQIPVQYFNPFRNVEIDPSLSREDVAKCAHFMGEVVGLGLRRVTECPLEVNLLPKSIQTRKEFEKRQPYFLGAAAAVLLIPLCFLGYTRKTKELTERQLADVAGEVSRLNESKVALSREQNQLNDLKSKADDMAKVVIQRTFWQDFLSDLGQRAVQGMWITLLQAQAASAPGQPSAATGGGGGGIRHRMEEGAPPQPQAATAQPTTLDEIYIEGAGPHTAEDLHLIDEFAGKLRESSFFDHNAPEKGVVIDKTTGTLGGQPLFTFVLRCKLATPLSTN
jgi:type IV pilus assembly protein PilM